MGPDQSKPVCARWVSFSESLLRNRCSLLFSRRLRVVSSSSQFSEFSWLQNSAPSFATFTWQVLRTPRLSALAWWLSFWQLSCGRAHTSGGSRASGGCSKLSLGRRCGTPMARCKNAERFIDCRRPRTCSPCLQRSTPGLACFASHCSALGGSSALLWMWSRLRRRFCPSLFKRTT